MTKYFVDGVGLDDEAGRWFVDYEALLPAVAARDVAQLRLPSRSGVVSRGLSWGLGSLVVAVDLPSTDSCGGLGPWESVDVRLRFLQALLARAGSVTVAQDGFSWSAEVVEVDVSDPSRLSAGAWRVNATFTLQPFWVESASYFALQVIEEATDGWLYFWGA